MTDSSAADAMRAALTTQLLDMAGILQPIYDAADGMKAELVSRGWSPTQAEESAGAWLTATLAAIGGAA
ncbi:hypothetical protein HEK616_40690 [Streptomyces nigrescens]|uniref:Uncharacterized protein n=1 Tax=Streptomyces nigrescens TaxID=1920 RepID=A0ABN6QWL6_STRNI|nr:hypothetical protein [Streptomyces nigrescens]BDM70582.1 hypothetical protein HEK616_40690 [Streptomyces nigrescens]